MTITGREVKKIIHAISLLREPPEQTRPSLRYEWQLQFYRGTELLGTAYLDADLIQCDGEDYHESWTLKRLYHKIVKKSGEDD